MLPPSEMMVLSGIRYARQLGKRWGQRAPQQFYRMLKLHRTPFESILTNMFEVLDKHSGRFAFPIVAAVAGMRPELVQWIVREGHEVASHGYNHLRYPTLSAKEREKDLSLSIQTFRKMGITINGFRAPYDNYTDDMPAMLDRFPLVWDGGFGYRPEHRERTHFFHAKVEDRNSSVTFIPLNIWSDDKMIDTLRMGPEEVSRTLIKEVSNASKTEGVIMFDLHPIRIGQPEFVSCLDRVLEKATELGGWCPTPVEAVRQWEKHGQWKGDSKFCLLLTGDIDNWVFSDYLRREIWRRMSRH